MKNNSQSQHFTFHYDSKGRFCSYWHQVDEILKVRPSTLLEIGVGTGFLSRYLHRTGQAVSTVTFDINLDLQPMVVGNIVHLPFKSLAFDTTACFEVLEHLPYEHFAAALREINRVTSRYAIISLPDVSRHYRLLITLPFIGKIEHMIHVPRYTNPEHSYDGEHYWEIGKKGYPLRRVLEDLREQAFSVEKTYRVFEYPYHRFFILKKNTRSPLGGTHD